jgi:hypothetical protein
MEVVLHFGAGVALVGTLALKSALLKFKLDGFLGGLIAAGGDDLELAGEVLDLLLVLVLVALEDAVLVRVLRKKE